MIEPFRYSRYNLIHLLGLSAAVCLLVGAMVWGAPLKTGGLSDFEMIPLPGDHAWYRDLGGRSVPELQDLDLFYHNIGPSISEARKADIIILGPSFALYAIDPDQLRKFGEKHKLKIYNMAFFGARSGEFSREIISRWSLRPKLWIINVDDNFDHFFSSSLKMWWFKSYSVPIPPLSYNRVRGWITVARRNIRWRIEDFLAERAGPAIDGSVYRRIDDGSVQFHDARFGSTENKNIEVVRDQDCHTNPKIIKAGRDYLTAIGGETVLTLIPNSTWCPLQAVELGKELGKEVILPPTAAYTSVDGGGHLDHTGATAFTKSFLEDLEKSVAFQVITAK